MTCREIIMNKKNRTDFAAYLLQKHYSDSTIASYCRALKRLHLATKIGSEVVYLDKQVFNAS